MKKANFSSALAALTAAALFGASAPFSKLLLENIQPVPLAALLYLGSGIGTLLLRLLWRGKDSQTQETSLSRADLPWLLGAVLAGGVAAPILLMLGLQHTPGAAASLLLNFETVATSLIAFFAFREAIGRKIWAAIGLVTAASILLSWDPSGGWGFSMGSLAILSACVLWGVDNNFTRNISAKDPGAIVIIKGIAAGGFSAVLALLTGQTFPGGVTLLLALLLGALSYGLSITLFILALRGLGAARTSALFGSAPFAGMLLSLILLGERPALIFLPALVLMAAGAWLLLSEDHEHWHLHESILHDHRHAHHDTHHTHEHGPDKVLNPNEEHAHSHAHAPTRHAHTHNPDVHHRHEHSDLD